MCGFLCRCVNVCVCLCVCNCVRTRVGLAQTVYGISMYRIYAVYCRIYTV